jgi:hypothetical protein
MSDEAMIKPPLCPVCHDAVRHDKFEDMYLCCRCYVFYEPHEVGREPDPKAGYLNLPRPANV